MSRAGAAFRKRLLETTMNRFRSFGAVSSVSSESSSDEELALEAFEKRCLTGQNVLLRLRFRVCIATFTASAAFTLLYVVTLKPRITKFFDDVCINDLEAHVRVSLSEIGFHGVILSMSLAPLADDIWLTRAVLGLTSAGLGLAVTWGQSIMTRAEAARNEDPQRLPWVNLVLSQMYVILAAGFGICSVRVMFYQDVHKMQIGMWLTIKAFLLALLVVKVCLVVYLTWKCHALVPAWWSLLCTVASLVFAGNAPVRELVKAKLNRAFERRSSERAAAGIAGLVGTFTVKEALQEATARFRSVQISDLAYDDIADNTPCPALFQRTSACHLHACDAFVSHSWHDDSEAKWLGMQMWRERHRNKNGGQEPTMWFDKCCIDQNNIDRDLRCLPVFLSGCKKLVVFVGPTYLSRLWCIMELFTFTHMCRSVDQIQFIPVVSHGSQKEDLDRIMSSIENFDAGKCNCYSAADKERLLRIIHVAFGGLEEFNIAVKRIFGMVGLQYSLSAAPRPSYKSCGAELSYNSAFLTDEANDSEAEDLRPTATSSLIANSAPSTRSARSASTAPARIGSGGGRGGG
mmetsp:Transcript_4838/g.13521  ORF Transcript_4838/g.13521 Transcript_4838/m.13521 type:complete len:574 (-) Transcript_4838:5-1726(-)